MASPQSQTTNASSVKDVLVTDFAAVYLSDEKINLSPSGIENTNSSGKNFFELINF
jgi:hypothetical protein